MTTRMTTAAVYRLVLLQVLPLQAWYCYASSSSCYGDSNLTFAGWWCAFTTISGSHGKFLQLQRSLLLMIASANGIVLYSTGEPVWAETSRIVSQIFLLLIFVAFLVFVIRQAITSPNVTQRIEEPAAQVDVPGKEFFQLVNTFTN